MGSLTAYKTFKRYAFEIFEYLSKKARETHQPFADYITKTIKQQVFCKF